MPKLNDIPFDEAKDVTNIKYRLAALDVGFDLRLIMPFQDRTILVSRADDPIRVSYDGADGTRRVIEGAQAHVLRRLRRLGYRLKVVD